jgi:hemoglobin-like flavoprotein
MLEADDVDRVRAGWAVAATLPEETAAAFYAHLFAIDPEARALFRDDMAAQGKKLTQTLDVIVDALDAPHMLVPTARDLAVRHVAYGVTPEQYDHVGKALIAALGDLMGGDFTPADRAAWARVYGALAREMVDAAYPAQPA